MSTSHSKSSAKDSNIGNLTAEHSSAEDELIANCASALYLHERILLGSGDDCAVLAHPDGKSVISTDMLVENIHFRIDWQTPYEIGARAAMQNLADVAAMGAKQHSAVVSVAVPKYFTNTQIVEISAGFSETLEKHGSALVGGDLTVGKQLVISATVVGDLDGKTALQRNGANPGDQIIFAGQIGWSAAGIHMLQQHVEVKNLPTHLQSAGSKAISSYKIPASPLASGCAAAGIASSLMDVSDSLERDGSKIAKASGVHLQLNPQNLEEFVMPLTPLADYLEIDPWEWVLHGGEDHGFLGTCPPKNFIHLEQHGFQVIGTCKPLNYSPPSLHSTHNLDSTLPATPSLLLGNKICGGKGWDPF